MGVRRSGLPFAASKWCVGNPNGVKVARRGTLAIDVDTGSAYQNTDGGTTWVPFGSDAPNNLAFGSGSDGVLNFDGVSTVLGMVPTATGSWRGVTGLTAQYVLTRDIFPTNMTVAAGVIVHTYGCRVFGTGTLTVNGYIGCPGANGGAGGASAAGAQATGYASNTLANASASGGLSTVTGTPTAGGASGTCPPDFASGAGGAAGVGNTGNGGDGGAGQGGGGGGGAQTPGGANGTAGGSTTLAVASSGSLDVVVQAQSGRIVSGGSGSNLFTGGSGGGSGRGANVAGQGAGGNGGQGGGTTVIGFRKIVAGAQRILSTGGSGGAAYQGAANGTTFIGGGGGGGGGWTCLIIGSANTEAEVTAFCDVRGGVGGAKNPTGSGQGGNGGAGGSGVVKVFRCA